MRFSRARDGSVTAKLDRVEADVLAQLAADLLELLRVEEAEGQDPLAALVGMPTGEVQRPQDPALARLLPDAYGDDEAAATEFRRYTEHDLRAGKRVAAEAVLADLRPLVDRGGRLRLERPAVDAWLGCLNDLRLVLATRLGVTEETDQDPPRDAPQAQAMHVYGWLGWLQESLLACVMSR